MKTRIFFVEANPAIHGKLRDVLESRYKDVQTLSSGYALIRRMEQDVPALIVLRDGLPDMRASAVLQALHQAGHDTPVIVIGDTMSTLGSVELIVCLELGADDYVRMPCDPRELLSRVENVLRRVPHKAPALAGGLRQCDIGQFVLDFQTRRLTRNGVPVAMHSSVFALLRLFAEHPLEVLSRRVIADRLRGAGEGHCDRSLDVLVCRLRRIVEPDPSRPRLIQTIRGRGYVFTPGGLGAAPIEFDDEPLGVAPEPAWRRDTAVGSYA
ncbi:winged helix-turn-helix domain-containing protein [Caballeronia sp. SEWSISQ10-4 2]|uniref:winged helix-turn-helix domain-containing protein n=1 Tax=Caballeronia sp. SEWSISQ10-4 2 TaxID=2937438 RepID=UPI002652D290|nr:winged helix-turn-helix domain-containing protein [Caballeronia sp. SEWSISQ10-4 2]MDN7179867.1 winged helix-turn-helix domain-containing protein [Caballeronia sp. SEWSISQ10-4 2]